MCPLISFLGGDGGSCYNFYMAYEKSSWFSFTINDKLTINVYSPVSGGPFFFCHRMKNCILFLISPFLFCHRMKSCILFLISRLD